ncbi:MAG: UDP-N-acetylmuramoyl-tripeptide--D-alanyl-D-alanine ligase [Bdellovibrionales bacterium]
MTVLASLLALAAFAFFAWRRLLTYLHIYQQEEYDSPRFLRWLIKTRSFDQRATLNAALLSGALYALHRFTALQPRMLTLLAGLSFALLFLTAALREQNPIKAAKKKLVMTSRAKRIHALAFALCLLATYPLSALPTPLIWILAIQIIPLMLTWGNGLLSPFEQAIKKKIMDEARARLAEVNPETVGVTGSFGKTSVKHILGHILRVNAPTLYTPGSVNTLMGVSRIIRENLDDGCKFFIVEMGAYGRGSIARLCDLTPPKAGIITAIGEAHVERFKTLDNVARTKFELAEAVLANAKQPIIIHESVLAQDYAREFVARERARFIVCGQSPDADMVIEKFEQTATGLTISMRHQGHTHALFVPLYGEHHVGNVALAFATALSLGIPAERASAALRTVPQIQHRLEVKPQTDGTFTIDDAYNANPLGFKSALKLLRQLGETQKGRCILVTPGLVEMGDKHDQAHRELGREAAKYADIVLAVAADRIPTFVEGFQSVEPQKLIQPVPSFAAARLWLGQNLRANDVVLLENDLPDLYETRLCL